MISKKRLQEELEGVIEMLATGTERVKAVERENAELKRQVASLEKEKRIHEQGGVSQVIKDVGFLMTYIKYICIWHTADKHYLRYAYKCNMYSVEVDFEQATFIENEKEYAIFMANGIKYKLSKPLQEIVEIK